MDEPVNRQKLFCQNSLCSLTSVSGWVLKSASCVWRLCLLWLNSALKTRRRTLLSLSPPVISSRYDTHFMLSWQHYNKTFIKEERGGVLISKQMHTSSRRPLCTQLVFDMLVLQKHNTEMTVAAGEALYTLVCLHQVSNTQCMQLSENLFSLPLLFWRSFFLKVPRLCFCSASKLEFLF